MVGAIVSVAVGAGVLVNIDLGMDVSFGTDVAAGAQETKIVETSMIAMNFLVFICTSVSLL